MKRLTGADYYSIDFVFPGLANIENNEEFTTCPLPRKTLLGARDHRFLVHSKPGSHLKRQPMLCISHDTHRRYLHRTLLVQLLRRHTLSGPDWPYKNQSEIFNHHQSLPDPVSLAREADQTHFASFDGGFQMGRGTDMSRNDCRQGLQKCHCVYLAVRILISTF